ncbi:hypothetical protein NCS55_00460900 [Fusarium keratoplasticum]|nr:hypothetical protein NCS55_00460900 [Fusarium keratoplasticum]
MGVLNQGSLLQGLAADLVDGNYSTAAVWTTALLAGALALSLLLTPRLDPREPPVVKPTIPLVGHIIGIIRHQSDYHRIIHNANPTKHIATLPMLNGKMYTIYDPHLVQTALRSRIASFEPFGIDFAQKTFGLSKETFVKVRRPNVFGDFNDAIHSSFQAPMLHKMNVHFLASISAKMDPISFGTALYGDHDPFGPQPHLVDDIWLFEESIPYFLLSLFPSITMPKAYRARSKLQALMGKYYSEGHDINDPTTSQLVKNRAGALRKHGFTGNEVGQLEVILPNVATLNAVPTFYWMLLFIFERPELVNRLRKEVEAAAVVSNSEGKRTATFDIASFDAKLPLLISCYRETMRLSNHSVSMRRIMQDMTITGADGQSYLLKKGVDLQLPAGVTHHDRSAWGQDFDEFDAERFLQKTRDAETERRRKAAYFPFGGGRHLCPGRNFAFAEILGFMAVLVLGFDVEPLGMRFGEMKMLGGQLASGTVRPEKHGKGLGGKITRRSGWENVDWRFEC